jgi:hypothetical protein
MSRDAGSAEWLTTRHTAARAAPGRRARATAERAGAELREVVPA